MHNHSVFETACADISSLLATRPLTELNGMRIFATGCTGFFGFWLLTAIACLNHQSARIEVVALSRDPEKFLHRHPEFSGLPWLTLVAGNIRDFRLGKSHFDAVIHAAADTSPDAAARPSELLADIVNGTKNLLTQISGTGYRKFLLVSSGAVYGEQAACVERLSEVLVLATDTARLDAYAQGKRIAETLCVASTSADSPAPVIARCFAFVGAHLPQHLAPAQFVRNLLRNGEIVLQGDGTPLRSYLDGADLALWLLTLLARGEAGRIFNVGGSLPISIAELAMTIRDTLKPTAQVSILGIANQAPRQRYLPDTTLAYEALNLAAWTPLTQSISRMASAIQSTQ